jgi:hypothetical protein
MVLWRLLLSLLLLLVLLCCQRQVRRRRRVAKPSVLRQAGDGAKGLAALVTLDLHPAGSVHAFVPAQVRELRVALEADFTSERLDRTVDVCVLFQARARGEGLATLGARVAPGPDVMRSNMTLKIAGIGEHLVAVLAGKSSILSVNHFVSKKIGPPGKTFGAVFALVLTSVVTVSFHHVIVQTEI